MKKLTNDIIYWEDVFPHFDRLLYSIRNEKPDWEDYLNHSKVKTGQKKSYNANEKNYVYETLKEIDKKYFEHYCKELSLKNLFHIRQDDSYFEIKNMEIGYRIDAHVDYFVMSAFSEDKMYPALTMIYYLTDQYEGAEIGFPEFNIRFKPKSNSFLIFPSKYLHEVEPAQISGERMFCQTFAYFNEDTNA